MTSDITFTNAANLPAEIVALVDAMNLNNSLQSYTPYFGLEVTETRRKYHLLNHVLSNGQRSGLYLIDRATLVVYQSHGYGRTNGRRVGTVVSLTADYDAANVLMQAKAAAV